MHSYYDSALPEIPADCETMPAPAEAATDIGADDGMLPLTLGESLMCYGLIVVGCVACVSAIVAWLK